MGWTFEPGQLAPVAVAAALYGRRAWTLRRRGRPVPATKVLSFAGGLLVLVAALVTPIDSIGESRLFSVHMAQHLMIGDLAPLLLALGLSGPLLRPLLAPRAVQRARVLTHPFVALPLWASNLWVWHLPRLYDAALAHDSVHALQHACFFSAGLLLWTTLLGLLPGPRWFGRGAQLAALGAVWVSGAALANVFLWSGRPYYPPYAAAPRTWGLSALGDQRAGGGVMLLEMMLVGSVVFVVLGLRWLEDAERRQRRLEQVVER
jgi:cytochrome c oxidase assembly factor CtaG